MFAVSIAAHGDKRAPANSWLMYHTAYLDDASTIDIALYRARKLAPDYFEKTGVQYNLITINITDYVFGQLTTEGVQMYHEELLRKIEG